MGRANFLAQMTTSLPRTSSWLRTPFSSTVPGATVRMELETYANEEIGSNEEIVVDFSGPSDDASFGLLTTITPSCIKIRSAQTFDPADVLV